MTKPLRFTQAAVVRAIRAAQASGLKVTAIRPDGTVVLSNATGEIGIREDRPFANGNAWSEVKP